MSASRAGAWLLAGIVLAGGPPASRSQVGMAPSSSPDQYPPALPRRKGSPPPRLAFRLVTQIELPGPLPGDPPRPHGDSGVAIPVAGALAVTSIEEGASPTLRPQSESGSEEPAAPWVVSPDGRYRFRTLAEGRLIAEKRCRFCRRGWKRRYSLRVQGSTPSPPLLVGERLYFATLDDQVYCVRADNGHRVWAVDVGDRVSRAPVLWTGSPAARGDASEGEAPAPIALLLVTPDGGGSLIALDPYDGSRLAAFELPVPHGRLATGALAAPGGEVVIGRQGYAAEEAWLLVLRLVARPPESEPRAVEDARVQGPSSGGSVRPFAPSTSFREEAGE